MKRIIAYLALVLIPLIVISGCGKKENPGENGESIEYEVTEGGEITVPLTGFETLNPFMKSSESTYYFEKLIFEGLFKVKENLDVSLGLAESYTMSNDASIMDIVLRDNVKFHDGSILTAEDIKFTVDVLKKGSLDPLYSESLSPLYREGGVYDISRISEVNVKSPKTLEIVFNSPLSDAPEYLTFPIVSKEALKSEEMALEFENYSAIGTGPYGVESMDSLKEVYLLKNSDYWSEKPKIDAIRGKVIASREVAKTSFEAGIVHAISDLNYLDWESFAQNDKVDITAFPSNRYEFMAFNFNKEYFQGEEGKVIRNAVAYGVNRDQILKNIYLGYGELVDSPVNPASWLSLKRDKAEKEDYSIEKAQSLLKEIGYEDRDGDGMLESQEGESISFTVIAPPTSQARIDTAKSISESLRKMGIAVEEDYELQAVKYESKEEEEAAWSQFQLKLSSGNYDLAVLGWEMSYLPDLSFAFHSNSDSAGNFIGYSDPKLDTLLENANGAPNREEKKRLYDEIQKHLIEEKPYISILYTNAAIINYKRIAGEFSPNYMDVYSEIEKWFVPEEFQTKEEK